MIDGKFWPIDYSRITDGYLLSLKNAKKLLNSAVEQFEKPCPDYALCIFLAASAIEEAGKGIMLMSMTEKHQKIDSEKWRKKFEDHETKITAAINHIGEFVKKGDKRRHKALDSIRQELISILELKFATLYIDWDARKNNFVFFDENSKSYKKKKAKDVLHAAKWIVNGYIQDGKLITERRGVILEMVRKGLAVAECESCAFKSNNLNEVGNHSKNFSEHKIGFRET